jgi:hypothetical protein
LACVLWQALEHRRHIALWAILFAFWLPVHVQSLMQRLGFGRDGRSLADSLPARWRYAFVGLLTAACLYAGSILLEQVTIIPVRKDCYPVSAFQFIADRQLHGKLVASFDWAQYAIMAFGDATNPEAGLRVQFDGRYDTCYPREVVDMHFDFEMGDAGPTGRYRSPHSPPVDGRRVLNFGEPDLLLINRNKPHAVDVVEISQSEWVLLYQDKLAQLWGRASHYGDPFHPGYLPPDQRQITDDPQSGFVAWPALPISAGKPTQLAIDDFTKL